MIALVDLPPPIHGMSLINKKMIEFFGEKDSFVLINTVPSFLSYFFKYRFWVFLKFFFFLYTMFVFLIHLFSKKHAIVYRPINGGKGKIFDLCYLLFARIFNLEIVIHHHSYSYITKYSRIFSLIVKLTNKNVTHVFLSAAMKEKIISLYDINLKNSFIVSNVAFFDFNENNLFSGFMHMNKKLTVGYLSNISCDKGIDLFCDLCVLMINEGIEFSAHIAGPFVNDSAKVIVNDVCNKYDCIKYFGALYGNAKADFFKNIDVFAFPSKYINEAEPLVLYEALQYGSFIVGSRQGSMQEVINKVDGVSFSIDGWADNAFKYIKTNYDSLLKHDKRLASSKVSYLSNVANVELSYLLKWISDAEIRSVQNAS